MSGSPRRRLHVLVGLLVLMPLLVSAHGGLTDAAAASPLPCSTRDPLSPAFAQSLANAYPGRRFSAQVYDSATGCVYDLNPGMQITTASVVKLEIMAGVLLRAQEQGRGLTSDEQSLIWPMITESANSPASTLFSRLGGAAGMDGISQAFGMNDTSSSQPVWGLTSTTAADQVHLVRQVIAGESGPLTAPYRSDAQYYTSNVVPEQRWGVSSGVPAGWTTFQKNGFAGSECCDWRLNSVGWVDRPGGPGWALAIMSDGWPSEESGTAAVAAIGDHINKTVAGTPFGSFDAVSSAGGNRVRVVGWTADPSDSAPTDVHVYMDGSLAAYNTANSSRPDVANAYPGYGPNHGFDLTFSVGDGTHSVCVYAINNGPPALNSLLTCRSITVRLGPFGMLDIVSYKLGGLRVAGWAIDPDTANPIDVHVYVNGTFFSLGQANKSRPDVGGAFPGYGNSHGYDTVIPWTASGSTTICAYGINVGAPAVNTELGCGWQDLGAPFGMLDVVSAVPGGLRVAGWAIDPDTANPIDVHVYVNGAGFNIGTANKSRPDVGGAFPGYGNSHGYDTVIPWTASGSRTTCAYGINVGTPAVNTQLGCRTA